MSTGTEVQIDTVSLARSLGAERAESLVRIFKPIWERAGLAVTAASRINVTDATQVREIRSAREQRLILRSIRLDAEKHRKAEKESAMREANAIQTIYNSIAALIEPEETRLEQCEKIAEIQEAKRRSKIKLERQADLAYLNFTTPAGIVLEDLDDREWNNLKTRATHEKAEKDRAAQEAAEQSKRDAEERDRLRAEKEEADRRAAQAEREARDARIEADRVARDARLAEQARKDVERQKEESAERARRAAESAPDAEKIREFARAIAAIHIGTPSTDAGVAVFNALARNIDTVLVWCESQAKKLEKGELK